jgi:hypothetical protein
MTISKFIEGLYRRGAFTSISYLPKIYRETFLVLLIEERRLIVNGPYREDEGDFSFVTRLRVRTPNGRVTIQHGIVRNSFLSTAPQLYLRTTGTLRGLNYS